MTNTQPTPIAEVTQGLKPCPGCGRDGSEDNACQMAAVSLASFKSAAGGYALRVECACGFQGPSSLDAEMAVARWNDRTPTPAKIGSEDEVRFSQWSNDTMVGQLRMQARDNLDPEYSAFMTAVAARLTALADAERKLVDMCASLECAAGCDEGVTEDQAYSEILSWGGSAVASSYASARTFLAQDGGKAG